MDSKIQQPKYDFDCEEFRYSHRFSQFACLTTPPLLSYAQYKVSQRFSRVRVMMMMINNNNNNNELD